MKHMVFILFVFLSLKVSVHAAEKLRISLPGFSSSNVSLPLGQMRGFFQEQGLQAEFIQIRSTVALAALVSGETDYHTIISPSLVAAMRGIPVRVVACFTPGINTAIIARREIKTIQDLKGKTIGLNSVAGGLEATVRLMLKHSGIDPDRDVKFLATGPIESRFAAMKQGLTVATAGSAPSDYLGMKIGYVVIARAMNCSVTPIPGWSRA